MTFSQEWDACERGDWMLWLAARAGVDRKLVVLAACSCARPALVHVSASEVRPRIAIETAERWARGEATIEEVREAKSAAYACAARTSAYAAEADYAADYASACASASAAEAAFAACAVADFADAAKPAAPAAAAADAAADAAGLAYTARASKAAAALASDARRASLKRSAELVRNFISAELF